jgi:translation initiation factor 2 subunit 3
MAPIKKSAKKTTKKTGKKEDGEEGEEIESAPQTDVKSVEEPKVQIDSSAQTAKKTATEVKLPPQEVKPVAIEQKQSPSKSTEGKAQKAQAKDKSPDDLIQEPIEDKQKKSKPKPGGDVQAETNVGTVGHVDHGKTTLVAALSGEWSDRYSEEQERGISIKLGYANAEVAYCPKCDKYFTLYLANMTKDKKQKRNTCPEDGTDLVFKRKISFVDSPGHEILMATMLSGASLMNGALLLVSATEKCPQPQTKEHLAALEICGLKKIIIVQNKIDAVSRERCIENFHEIQKFIKGTVAENAPIVPVSAIYKVNLDVLLRRIEEIIPTPKLDGTKNALFHVARSFDINRPGTDIENLHGGVIGGSVSQGIIKINDVIEIRPGVKKGEKYTPIITTVKSIYQGTVSLEEAHPGGLIALGTEIDPSITKADNLIGNLAGHENELPLVQYECDIIITLLPKVLGSEEEIEITPLKLGEPMLLVTGTSLTSGIIDKIGKKNRIHFKLKRPISAEKGSTVAVSRSINKRYRLIGYGSLDS